MIWKKESREDSLHISLGSNIAAYNHWVFENHPVFELRHTHQALLSDNLF